MDPTGKRLGRPAAMRALKPGLPGLVVLAALSIAYVVFWLFMAGELRDGVARWSEARRAEGYTVLFSRLRISGFPFVLRLDLERPGLGAPDGGVPWTWEGERAVAEMRPWNLRHVDIDLSGAHTLGLVVAGRPVTYTGMAGNLTGVLVMAGAWPSSAEIHIKDLDLSTADGAERVVVKRADLTARRTVGKTSDDPGSTLDVRLRAEDVRVPERLSLPLGNHLARLTVVAGLLGPIPAGPWPQSLATWRDEGGTVEVERLGITYGPLSAQATGTVALDGDMQPIGAFTAKVQGFRETVDALRKRGLVRRRDAVTAKLVLGALARTPKGGGPPTLNLAITVQNRTLFAGPVPLARLPAVDWKDWPPAR